MVYDSRTYGAKCLTGDCLTRDGIAISMRLRRGSFMPEIMSPTSAVELLHDSAQNAQPRTHARLAEVQALFAGDLRLVEQELMRATQDGVAPATHAASHLLRAGGKRIRPLTVLLSASCFGPVSAVARELAVVSELIHLATLLHDDVLDDCDVRRGSAAARCLWGNAVSVLSGDLLLTHALERVARLEPRSLLPELVGTLRRLVDGEVLQLRGRSRLDTSQETYFRIVHGKTASLFEWAGRVGAMCCDASDEQVSALAAYGRHLGTAFQLIDDALDYCGNAQHTGKALHADLKEGKMTLPLINALRLEPSLANQLEAARSGDCDAASRVAAAIHALDACAPVRALAHAETVLALEALEWVPSSRARELLRAVAQELSARVA
jgi:octaprenyl-diphosphate synthase